MKQKFAISEEWAYQQVAQLLDLLGHEGGSLAVAPYNAESLRQGLATQMEIHLPPEVVEVAAKKLERDRSL